MSVQQVLKALLELSDEDKAALMDALSSIDKKEEVEVERTEEVDEIVKEVAYTKPSKRNKKRKAKPVNKFEQSQFFDAYKDDSRADELLWKGREPSDRRKPPRQVMVDVDCSICKKKCKAPKNEVFFMSRDEYSYTCPKCVGGGRR